MIARSSCLAGIVSCFLVSWVSAINPCEVATLARPEGASYFGRSTGISGDWIVVGAPGEGPDSSIGAGYFFRREGEEWIQHQRVQGSQLLFFNDGFGAAVAMDGEWAVIGAPHWDPAGSAFGQAYIYRFDGSNWFEHTFLAPSISNLNDGFGQSIDIEGDVIAVGAPGANTGGAPFGRVFVFRWNGTAWIEEAALSPEPLVTSGGEFAWRSVAISGNRIVAGDGSDSSAAEDAGAVYVFAYDGTSWSQEAKLVANDPGVNPKVGDVVAIDGTAIVTGANSAAYIFEFGPDGWRQERKLTNNLSPFFDTVFGRYTAMHQGSAFVYGAPGVFVFERTGSSWQRVAIATSSSGASFGHISIDGILLVSGRIIFNLLGGPLCIPALSAWSVGAFALLLATAATLLLRRRPRAVATLAVLLGCTAARADHPALAVPHHPENLMVRFQADLPDPARANILDAHGATEKHRVRSVPGLTILRVPAARLEQVMLALRANPNVRYSN
jgi:hypothetical protein